MKVPKRMTKEGVNKNDEGAKRMTKVPKRMTKKGAKKNDEGAKKNDKLKCLKEMKSRCHES